MKKIIFASDGKSFPKGAFEFAKELHRHEPVLLTGAFLHSLNFEEFLPGVFAMYASPALEFLEEEKKLNKQITKQFEDLCQRNMIEYRVHEQSPNWNIDDLTKETRFADLMLMSEELFCNDINMYQPNSFMQQAIHKSECPVFCVPENYSPVKKIIFAYDGKKESMFALKQFCNLFPQLTALETKIIYAKDEADESIPDLIYLEEFAARHFSDLDIEKVVSSGKKFFEERGNELNNSMLVSGAYSRSGLSTSLNRSFVETIIHEHRIPVFIAHT